MRCPDCAAALSGMPLSGPVGVTRAFRCSRCGGWWVEHNFVNEVSYVALLKFPRSGIDSRWMSSKGSSCPIDNTPMTTYHGEAVPENVSAKRCPRCNWWWFPTDDFYRYKEAFEAKINYMRLWGSRANVTGLMLPLAMIVVLLAGLVIGLYLVDRQQKVSVPAYETFEK